VQFAVPETHTTNYIGTAATLADAGGGGYAVNRDHPSSTDWPDLLEWT